MNRTITAVAGRPPGRKNGSPPPRSTGSAPAPPPSGAACGPRRPRPWSPPMPHRRPTAPGAPTCAASPHCRSPAAPPPPGSPRTRSDNPPRAHGPAGQPSPWSPCCSSASSPRRASLPKIEGAHACRVSSVVGGEDALVAGGQQAGGPEHERAEAGHAAPAAGDVVAGRVFDRGVGPLGAGAPGVGAAPGGGGVVVFLPGLGRYVRADGDGLLCAAGGRGAGGGEDLGAGPGQGDRAGGQRGAGL